MNHDAVLVLFLAAVAAATLLRTYALGLVLLAVGARVARAGNLARPLGDSGCRGAGGGLRAGSFGRHGVGGGEVYGRIERGKCASMVDEGFVKNRQLQYEVCLNRGRLQCEMRLNSRR